MNHNPRAPSPLHGSNNRRVRHLTGCLCAALLSLFANQAEAQSISLATSADRTSLSQNESLTLTVTSNLINIYGTLQLTYPSGVCSSQREAATHPCDFVVVRSSELQNMSLMGRTSQIDYTRTLVLQPLRSGQLTIGPFTVSTAGHSASSTPIQIQVAAVGDPRSQQRQPPARPAQTQQTAAPRQTPTAAQPTPRQPATSVQRSPAQRQESASGQQAQVFYPRSVDPNMPFVAVSASTPNPYVGQQIVLDYEVFTSLFDNWELVDIRQPSFEHFWFENAGSDGLGQYRRRQVDVSGVPYRSRLASRWALIPLQTGRIELGSMTIEAADWFRGRVSVNSPAAAVEVRPLPDGAPQGFSSSNVGSCSFTVNVDKETARVGDPIRIWLRVEGTGLVSLMDLPRLRVEGAANIRDPVESRELRFIPQQGIGGFKEHSYLVFPTEEGRLTVNELSFHYFDPQLESYVTVQSEPIEVEVAGVNPNAHLIIAQNGTDYSLFLNALPGARTATIERYEPNLLSTLEIPQRLFWSATLLPPVIFFLSLLLSAILEKRAEGAAVRYRRSAGRRARAVLNSATREHDRAEALGRIASAMRRYLRERLDIKASALTMSELVSEMRRMGLSEELTEELADILQSSENARFNQQELPRQDIKSISMRAQELLRKLEGLRT